MTASSSRFDLGPEIGSGAIAAVHRLWDREGGRWYAGKILHPRHDRDPNAVARFHREAELACRMDHPNVVKVHGMVDVPTGRALLMELVEGRSLDRIVASAAPLPEDEIVELATGIAAGLGHAHAHGIVHRDLKPANVLVTTVDGVQVAKIADFGMARAASFANADRRALTVLGTPPYMAPECLDPIAVDPRTDLYALGCILHEMASGAPPYGGPTPFAVLEAHREASIPSLPEHYSLGLRSLVRRLLAKAPGDRPQSATSVLEMLRDLRRPPSTALVPIASALPAVKGRCAGCGADVLPEVRICFRCGLPQIVLRRGPMSVFVVGPGRGSEKLDSAVRQRLLDWLESNAEAGIDASPLRHQIPRLPFPLMSEVDESTAQTLVMNLQRLGIDAAWCVGGPTSHPGVRETIRRLTGRKLLVAASIGGAPAIVHPFIALATLLPTLLVAAPILYGISSYRHGRPTVVHGEGTREPLPASLRHGIDVVCAAVASIAHARHRDALRTIVHRAVELVHDSRAADRDPVALQLSSAVQWAAVAAARLDELDRSMSAPEFDPAAPGPRALMLERDLWSARLLELTASLDRIHVDHAVEGPGDERLDALRAHIEALEEVQRA